MLGFFIWKITSFCKSIFWAFFAIKVVQKESPVVVVVAAVAEVMARWFEKTIQAGNPNIETCKWRRVSEKMEETRIGVGSVFRQRDPKEGGKLEGRREIKKNGCVRECSHCRMCGGGADKGVINASPQFAHCLTRQNIVRANSARHTQFPHDRNSAFDTDPDAVIGSPENTSSVSSRIFMCLC